MLVIKNGLIHDAVHKRPYVGDIAVENGKISAIGKELPAAGAEVVDATGLEVYPGFVEAHSHIGLTGYGANGTPVNDINESSDPIQPHLRAIDGFNPFNDNVAMAASGGVTTICTGPGSANVVGGTFTVVKTAGTRVDDMTVIPEAAMKCAMGENPKNRYKDKGGSTRMSVAAKLREALFKARDYERKVTRAQGDPDKTPAFDIKLNAMLPVMRGEMPLKIHAHQANDIFTAIRIAKEFGVKLTLEHVTEGHLIADALAAEGYPVAVGPTLCGAGKFELRNKSWTTPAILHKAGCRVSIITDAPVTPQHYLPLCAGLAVKAGLDPFAALQAITINPARHVGAADRVGSLEVGKDADIVLTDGSPFEVATNVLRVFIDGKEIPLVTEHV